MKHPYGLPMYAAVLAMALAVSLPSAAGAKSEGHGREGRGHSSEARGGHTGKREVSRGRGSHSSGERGYAQRVGDRQRADWRGSGSRSEVRYRDPGSEHRADVRWRDSGSRRRAPSYHSPTQYRNNGPSHSSYYPWSYYGGSFHRPRYGYRSGFSLGVVIGSRPSYGYRYFDPYCDMGFRNLGVYYDHCDAYGHPDVIQVLDIRSGYPIASCAYRGGDWVVDDCY